MTITILDGGMGQELIRRAGEATDLWSLKALMDAPDMVRVVHDEFFAAGADVATTNSYSVLPDRLEPKGYGDRLEPLMRRACALAVAARDAHGSGIVAGSLGPQGFSYQPDKAPPAEEAAEVYARLARMQAEYVDVHLLETMASVDQARGGLMGAGVTGKPVWLALTVDDADGRRLRSGEMVTDVAPLLREFAPEAVLINCSRPEAVRHGVRELAKLGVPFGAYANGFEGIEAEFNDTLATVDLLTARRDLDPETYLAHAQDWVREGATLIGGCCEVGPAHIAALAAEFKRETVGAG
ncbi:homocysteine S-methyltransferase family protein [Pseudaestuariivita atlantica]|uniref:Homocysteine methyltransferase n=1 Tax=Pseudaestuariivita atlantica TaxID=1317121 RepID=A0A0L1JP47_9RHOB|nr:homocysteine S-methyltransferase family protein [Pseudaestuariivita atlantica]KNG93482.1 homocysteine methyltransferase [Pseudaestuariivita atlantica]